MILVRSWREPSPRPGRSYRRSPGRTSTRCTQGFFWVISKYKWYHIHNTGTWSVANKPNIEKFYLFYSNLNHHLIVYFFREGVKLFYDFVIFHVLLLCTLLFYVHVKKKNGNRTFTFSFHIVWNVYNNILSKVPKIKMCPLDKKNEIHPENISKISLTPKVLKIYPMPPELLSKVIV